MSDQQTQVAAALGKREQTKASNREAILSAAREVFAELGYGATTVRDIVRKTGLASGTFYNYYRSKEEVFQALMDDVALQVRPILQQGRAEASSAEDFIRITFRTYLEYVSADRPMQAVMRRNTGAIRVRMDTPEILAGFDELQVDIEAAIESGLLPPVDAGLLTASFVGIAFEIGDRMLERDPPDVDAAVDFATKLVLSGLQSISDGPE
jgi:AcrR family transcriptional regulator